MEEVRTRVLRDQLGTSLLRESGADLDAPINSPRDETKAAARDETPRHRLGTRPRPRHAVPNSEPDKPRGRPLPGPRKHVSALRAKDGMSHHGQRQRIERGETEDRKGRTITVERHVATAPPPRKPARAQKLRKPRGKPQGGGRSGGASRGGQPPPKRR